MERPTFQQRGIVAWRRLPLGMLLQLGPMLLAGGILAAMQIAGWSLLIIVPIFAAIIPAMMSGAIANATRWREPRIAGTVGFVLGAAAYLSQFYFELVYWNWNIPGAILRIDLVPWYILETMNHQRIGDDVVDPVKNWGFLIVETIILGSAFAIAHVMATKTLYCPICGTTLKGKASILPPDFATALAVGVAEDQLDDLPHDKSGGQIEGNAWSNVEVLYCFHPTVDADPVFYLTLNETRFAEGVGAKLCVLDKVQLTPDEMLAIGEKCPGLVISPSYEPAAEDAPAEDAESDESTA
jgi:hypothetical protein